VLCSSLCCPCLAWQAFLPARSIRQAAFGHPRKPQGWLQVEGEEGSGICWEAGAGCGTRRQVLLPCSGNSRSPALGSRRNFPPGWIGTAPRGLFAFLCSMEQDHLSGQGSPGPLWLGYCLLLMHHGDGLLCPAAGGRKAFIPPRWPSKSPWGFFASSAALGMAPCQGFFGPFWPGTGCSCFMKVALVPCIRGEAAFYTPRAHLHGGPRGLLPVLRSTEHSPLPGLLAAILASFLPVVLAPPRHYLCPGSVGLLCPWRDCSGSKRCSSALGSASAAALAWAKQPALARAPGLLHQQQLQLCGSPCMQRMRRAGTGALSMHHWPRSTAQQVWEGRRDARR